MTSARASAHGSPRLSAVSESLALAVDFGGTKVEAGLVDASGRLIAASRSRAQTGATATSGQLEDAVASVVRHALSAAGSRVGDLVGVGIGSAGPIDVHEGTISPLNVPAWRAYPLKSLVAELVQEVAGDLPVTLRIDGEAIAIAEHWVGAAQGTEHMIGMVVSTGVGGGIISGGRTVPGRHGNAGHIGHVGVPGPESVVRCACGGIGCVEAIASGPRSVAWARDQGWAGESGEDLAASAAAGDPIARAAIRRSAAAVGAGIVSAAAMLDLEVVAIGGGFSRVSPDYLDLVRQPLTDPQLFTSELRVVASGLGADGPLIGAGGLIHRADRLG